MSHYDIYPFDGCDLTPLELENAKKSVRHFLHSVPHLSQADKGSGTALTQVNVQKSKQDAEFVNA